jgi:hypothetical protein
MVNNYTCLCCNYLFVYKHLFFLDSNWITSLYSVYCMVTKWMKSAENSWQKHFETHTVCHNSYFYFDMTLLFIFQHKKYVVLSIIQCIHEWWVCVTADKMFFGQTYNLFPVCFWNCIASRIAMAEDQMLLTAYLHR